MINSYTDKKLLGVESKLSITGRPEIKERSSGKGGGGIQRRQSSKITKSQLSNISQQN